MIRHLFLDKICTIHENSEYNTGNHPIMELFYGKGISRGVLHFDEKEIINLINDKTFPDIDKLIVKLKMTNCAAINGAPYNRHHIKSMDENFQRAISFDIILFKLPQDFDSGLGYDYLPDFWNGTPKAFSTEGCNWYQSYNGKVWEEEGIYTTDNLKKEITKYNNQENSIIIGRQHFNTGLEMLDIDITEYVKSIINGEENYGIGVAFSPLYEETERDILQYVGFFTENTNLFYHPFIELTYNDYICDNREDFYIGRTNRLYLYTSINNEMVNLDELPICSINGKEYEVKQATKGVYYAEISPENINLSSNTIYYDTWANLALNGVLIEDVELEFVALPQALNLKISSNNNIRDFFTLLLSGINNGEMINRGDIREVNVEYRKQYTVNEKTSCNGGYYRLYVKDGNREYDVVSYHPIEKCNNYNYFIINTNDLIPNEYFIDIKTKFGREEKYFKEILKFTIKNDISKTLL